MAIQIADNFSYQGSKPLDVREKFDTVADMAAYADASLYDGCFAYVKAVKKYYTYDSSNAVDSTTGKWREYTSGGSASDLSPADVALVKQNFQVNPYGTMPTEMTASDVIAVKNAFVLT